MHGSPQWVLHTAVGDHLWVDVLPTQRPGAYFWVVRQQYHDDLAASLGEDAHAVLGEGIEYGSAIALDVALVHASRVQEAAANLDRCINHDRLLGRTECSALTLEALTVYTELTR